MTIRPHRSRPGWDEATIEALPRTIRQVLMIGSFAYGFRIIGPFEGEIDDPQAIEEEHMTERDHHEGFCAWFTLQPPHKGSEK